MASYITNVPYIQKGKDGTGIRSADVVFCVTESNTTEPSDNLYWYTTFAQLTMKENTYVWSCTKITLTDGTTKYTGKQCLGASKDFVTITEQYAIGSSPTTAPTSGWGTTYTPTKELWLWTRNRMEWKNSTIITYTYTTPICIGYFSKDGNDGEDAVWYEIVPETFSVSLDANGNWAEGTNITTWDGEECAYIFCTYIKHVGSKQSSPNEYLVLLNGKELLGIDKYTGNAYVRKTDSSVVLSLYTFNEGNPPTYSGALLARVTITVNRAGANGTSVKVQFSANGSDGWHDVFQTGDKYMRIWNGKLWSSAIKMVGDDGNSFNVLGTVMRHYGKTSDIKSPVIADSYIVDKHDVGGKIDKPCYVKYVEAPDSSVSAAAMEANVGDAYVVQDDGSIWVANEEAWVNLGQIQGPSGESVTIVNTSVRYAISASGTIHPANSSSEWKNSVQTVTDTKPYLWSWTHVEYSDGNYTDSYSVSTRGNRGAVFRQHDGFVDGNFDYQSGSATEEFIDVVRMNGVWYRCVQSYSSSDMPTANDVTNPKYWSSSGMTNMDFVATKLLLAEDATINMLGTNEMNLYDKDERFGSFRVPHNVPGVDGNVDDGMFALWLGASKAENAPFRVSKDGAISATSGNIGSFVFDTYTTSDATFYNMIAVMPGTSIEPYSSISFNYRGIGVNSGEPYKGGYVSIGYNGNSYGNERSWSDGLIRVTSNFADSNTDGMQSANYAQIYGNSKNTVVAYNANADGGKENFAFLAEYGDILSRRGLFKGFRPNIRMTSISISLGDEDNVIICTNSGGITLTFPSSPKLGQMYVVFQHGGRIDFYAGGKEFKGKLSGTRPYSGTSNQLNIFFYDGTYWRSFYAT